VNNPFKIISFLSLAALLLVSFVTFDTAENVEAVTPAANKVLFLDDSGNKITYYKTTDVAYFYINDADLETTKQARSLKPRCNEGLSVARSSACAPCHCTR
jgi:hypothetical protein